MLDSSKLVKGSALQKVIDKIAEIVKAIQMVYEAAMNASSAYMDGSVGVCTTSTDGRVPDINKNCAQIVYMEVSKNSGPITIKTPIVLGTSYTDVSGGMDVKQVIYYSAASGNPLVIKAPTGDNKIHCDWDSLSIEPGQFKVLRWVGIEKNENWFCSAEQEA